MSDQGKWFKLWVTSITDFDLENLELHQWARWVRLGVFIKAHGTDGKLMISPPARALQNALRIESYEELIKLLKMLPGYTLHETNEKLFHLPFHSPFQTPLHDPEKAPNCYLLVCKNWYKYQGDLSSDRVKKYRSKKSVSNTVSNTVSCNGKCNGLRREEKRRDVKSTSTSTSRSAQGGYAGATPPALEQDPETMDLEAMEKLEEEERNRAWKQDTSKSLSESEEASPEEFGRTLKDWRKSHPRGGTS